MVKIIPGKTHTDAGVRIAELFAMTANL